MSDDLPAAPLSDDLIDRIAAECALHVSDHIAQMYPDAAAAVSHKSMSRSISGVVRNFLSEAGRCAEQGKIETWLKETRSRRLSLRRLYRAAPGDQPKERDDG